ncbi:flavodoxin domain-containing protein [Salinibacillus xinjiangensis]|uniref:Flavodoxin n=1 Tax=Salinibacillus xinjiangensis TaxID=1229268 RepID=A0A6G1X9J1_9BACI|nr:flavodoxin domain-containing protein [Salinibacillus xinjiangensis]MRG87566.1 flavodoxin [Salinibacillus xinjiangensis]
MKVAIVYTSVTGNTEGLANRIAQQFERCQCEVEEYRVEEFLLEWVKDFDILVIGTYTWGNGEVPEKMKPLLRDLQRLELPHLVTGVFGTGDRFFPHFCGAVDHFKNVLMNRTKLAVTLKVELFPQKQDETKCLKFVEKCMMKMKIPL